MPKKTLSVSEARSVAESLKSVPGDRDFTPGNVVTFLRKGPRSYKEIQDHFSRTKAAVRGMMSGLSESGSLVYMLGGQWCLEKKPPPAGVEIGIENSFVSDADGSFLFGFASDQHLGSRYARLDVLSDLYDKFADRGVERVFNSGNWIDGECGFNRHELLVHGVEGQCRYLAENYPARKGIRTYAVAGDDHEGWFCFSSTTRIKTSSGDRMICHVKEGDLVFTHRGRYRRVVKTFKRQVCERLCTIRYGSENRRSNKRMTVTCTGGHPIYAKQDGLWRWSEARSLCRGDKVAVCATFCKKCDSTTAWWHDYCSDCWPNQPVEHLREMRGGFRRAGNTGGGTAQKHLKDDILPVCEAMKGDGWTVVPTGGGVAPDIVAFRDGIAVAVEVEHERGSVLALKKAKYVGHPISVYVDRVEWIDCNTAANKPPGYFTPYEEDPELDPSFVAVDVVEVSIGEERKTTVYNLKVDEDETYVAGKMLVHNCSREGIDIGKYAANVMLECGRDDWTNLGYMECFIPLVNKRTGKSSNLAVIHPGGGSCYAISYAPQKIIESLEGGEKPAAVLFGHFHKLGLWNIRNVWSFLVGCQQDQTSFMRKKRIEAHIGGGVVKMTQDHVTGAIIGCAVEFFRYFNTGYYNNRWSKSGPVNLPKRR